MELQCACIVDAYVHIWCKCIYMICFSVFTVLIKKCTLKYVCCFAVIFVKHHKESFRELVLLIILFNPVWILVQKGNYEVRKLFNCWDFNIMHVHWMIWIFFNRTSILGWRLDLKKSFEVWLCRDLQLCENQCKYRKIFSMW